MPKTKSCKRSPSNRFRMAAATNVDTGRVCECVRKESSQAYHIDTRMPGAIPPRPTDTALDAERVQVALLRAAPVARRLHLALALSATIIGAARRALARSQPQATHRELDVWFVELHYGAEVAEELRREFRCRDFPRRGA